MILRFGPRLPTLDQDEEQAQAQAEAGVHSWRQRPAEAILLLATHTEPQGAVPQNLQGFLICTG